MNVYGPTVGALNAKSPKIIFQFVHKNKLVAKYEFSYGFTSYFACAKLYTFPLASACAPAPYALNGTSKLRFVFGYFFSQFLFLLLFGTVALGAMVSWCHSGAIYIYIYIYISRICYDFWEAPERTSDAKLRFDIGCWILMKKRGR